MRSILHRMGYRFTVRGPHNRNLPGRPDIVLPRHRAALFVHGCFWHRHAGCSAASFPRTRQEYWRRKFERNVARDRRHQRTLKKQGWRCIVVWECQIVRQPERVAQRLDKWLGANSGNIRYAALPDKRTLYRIAEARADYNTLSPPSPNRPKP